MKDLFRLLTADEIECRIGDVGAKGVSLLLYKDARVDANILDETVGPYNWKKLYTRDNANCIVSLWDANKGEWISKEDTGTESNYEKEKGLASDSFKRACFVWGIGRELYSAPFIYVPCETEKDQNGKYKLKNQYVKYDVLEIGYDESRRINKLKIVDAKTGAVVYEYPSKGKKATTTKTEANETVKSNDDFEIISLPNCLNHVMETGKLAGKKGCDFVLDVKSEKSSLTTLTKLANANVGKDSVVAKNLLSYIKNNKIKIQVKAPAVA